MIFQIPHILSYSTCIQEEGGCSKNIIAYYKFDYSYRDVCNGYNAINDGAENDLVSSTGISGGGFAVQLLANSAKLCVPGLNGYTWG